MPDYFRTQSSSQTEFYPKCYVRQRRSEREAKAQLNLPVVTDRGRNDAGARVPNGRVRQGKLRRVEQIKELSAELNAPGFARREVLEQGPVEVHPSRPVENVAPPIAVCKLLGHRPHSAGGVERRIEPERARPDSADNSVPPFASARVDAFLH